MQRNLQLARLRHELEDARRRAHALAVRAGERWARQPPAGGWTVGHCVEHLNVTSEAFLPRLEKAIEEARRRERKTSGSYRLDPVGWLLHKVLEPPYRVRAKTPAAFDPTQVAAPEAVLDRFDRLQARLDALVANSEGLAIDGVRVVSPFGARVTYSAYAAFWIIVAHQRRHLWQGEKVLQTLA